jgi:hypothetical protein
MCPAERKELWMEVGLFRYVTSPIQEKAKEALSLGCLLSSLIYVGPPVISVTPRF